MDDERCANRAMTRRSWPMAVEQARIGLAEGGIPIGAALVVDGKVLGRRPQPPGPAGQRDPPRRDRRAGERRPAAGVDVRPGDDVHDAVALRHVHRRDPALQDPAGRASGENRTFLGAEDLLRAHGVEVVVLDDPECVAADDDFIAGHPTALERGHRRT